jgi:hypothetical protein
LYGNHGFSAASERRNAYVSGKNNIIFPFPETLKGKNNINKAKERGIKSSINKFIEDNIFLQMFVSFANLLMWFANAQY